MLNKKTTNYRTTLESLYYENFPENVDAADYNKTRFAIAIEMAFFRRSFSVVSLKIQDTTSDSYSKR